MAKDTDRRFTPAWLIELVTDALGPIVLDPCTEPDNPTGARHFFALPERDGLTCAWGTFGGLVWCNPPFSALLTWAERAAEEVREYGAEIVILTPVDSTTRWYGVLTGIASMAAPLRKRVRFGFPAECEQPKSAVNGATMLWYCGSRTKAFAAGFRDHAHLYMPGLFPALGAP